MSIKLDVRDDAVVWKRAGRDKPRPKNDKDVQIALKNLDLPPNYNKKDRIILL